MDPVSAPDMDGAVDHQLSFSRKRQAVTNKIHATGNIDEIMLDLSQDIRDLFACDRLTIYSVSDDRTVIESKLKTGMNSFKDFKLPISESSIAGYVALFKKTVNVRNVYDESELKS
jgi:light-regulated signal transduction histidine kinase (bacteriophytochrome)